MVRLPVVVCLAFCALVADARAVTTLFGTESEAAFNALFPDRMAPSFENASDEPLTSVVTPEAIISQVTPDFSSLLDSSTGFVWRTDSSNPELGTLRIEFLQPVVAASARYNWFPSGPVSGEVGTLSVAVNGQSAEVATFDSSSLPFQLGWLGAADLGTPFTQIDLAYTGQSGALSFYFSQLGENPAVEFVPAPSLSGDFDGDGSVTRFDYQPWAGSYGEAVPPASGADGNGDGVINAADYTVLRDAFDAQRTLSVPEPGSAALAIVWTACVAWRRRNC